MAIDIFERLRAEEALREAKQAAQECKARYEQAISMISDIVWCYEVSADGEHLSSYISPAAEKMLDLPNGTIGSSFDEYFSYVHPDDLPIVQGMLLEVLRTPGKEKTAEHRLLKADGTAIWVRLMLQPVPARMAGSWLLVLQGISPKKGVRRKNCNGMQH
jgi:PAS domain-containing protein